GNVGVVFTDESTAQHHVNGDLDRRQGGFAEDRYIATWLRLHVPFPYHREGGLLGILDKAVAVHRDRIGVAQKTEVAGLYGAGRHFGGRDGLRYFADSRKQIFPRDSAVGSTQHQLLDAASCRYQTDADLD